MLVITPHRGRVVLAAQAYEWLRSSIVRGEISPGTRMTESELARRLGVSRTPIREALRNLESEGLVRRDGAGLVAAPIDRTSGVEVLLLRELLEPTCGELSAPALTPVDFAELDSVLSQMRAALADGSPPVRLAELNNRFHDRLYSRCPYPRLLEEVRRIREHFVTYWLYQTYTDRDRRRVVREHAEIAALAGRIAHGEAPAEQLGAVLKVHIGAARRRFERNALRAEGAA
jgi:DNA-binding GntR family transcriptional regulator